MYVSCSDLKNLNGSFIFLDTDFVSFLFDNDEQIFSNLVKKFEEGNVSLVIDSLVAFEFLRDVFLPSIRDLKEQFVSDTAFFLPADFHHENLAKIKENALILSKIYAHKNVKGPSMVDLFLAGRVMLNSKEHLILTGNKKDYPNFIFDIEGTITIEQTDGDMRVFTILKFNSEKFNNCCGDLEKLE